MRGSTSCSPFRCQAAPYRVSAFGWFFISVIQLLSTRSILANLVPRVLFLGFGGGAPHLQSQGKAPWERGWILAGFSVAFESTGWSTSLGGRAPFAPLVANVECRRHELLGGFGGMSPREICKIGLSEVQFPAFPGPELGYRKGFQFKGLKNIHKKRYIWLIWQLSVCSCSFFSWFQNRLQ